MKLEFDANVIAEGKLLRVDLNVCQIETIVAYEKTKEGWRLDSFAIAFTVHLNRSGKKVWFN